jgi:hypothetical protein
MFELAQDFFEERMLDRALANEAFELSDLGFIRIRMTLARAGAIGLARIALRPRGDRVGLDLIFASRLDDCFAGLKLTKHVQFGACHSAVLRASAAMEHPTAGRGRRAATHDPALGGSLG